MKSLFRALPSACVWMLLAIVVPAAGLAQDAVGPDLTQVSTSVSALIDPVAGANAAVIVTDQDVIVVDSHVAPVVARQTMERIRLHTPRPVTYLINTHWHVDHSHGNRAYADEYPDLVIVSHPATADSLPVLGPAQLAMWPDFLGSSLGPTPIRDEVLAEVGSFEPELPDRTVDDHLAIERGTIAVEVLFAGRGHTSGDLVVLVPDERVLISGDLLLGFTGYPADYAATLRAVLELPFDVVVPGHGPVDRNPRPRIERMAEEMETIVAAVRSQQAAGATLEQALEHVDTLGLEGLIQRREQVVKALYEGMDSGGP